MIEEVEKMTIRCPHCKYRYEYDAKLKSVCCKHCSAIIIVKRKYKCETCKDTKRIPKPMPKEPHPCTDVNLWRAEQTIPCPDCEGD